MGHPARASVLGDHRRRRLRLSPTAAVVRLCPGLLLLRGSGSYVIGVPKGESVFEETLHVMVEPPWVWRARLGYVFTFGSRDQHSLGPAVDVLDVPKRHGTPTVRVGPIVRLAL